MLCEPNGFMHPSCRFSICSNKYRGIDCNFHKTRGSLFLDTSSNIQLILTHDIPPSKQSIMPLMKNSDNFKQERESL